VSFDAAAYYMRVRDALVPFQLAEVAGRDFFRNAGRTRHRGLELTASAPLTGNLQLTTSYTYTDLVFDNDGSDTLHFEGNLVPGVPPHHWVLRPTLRTAYVAAEPEVEVTSGYFADDANSQEAENPGVTVINLRIRAARPIGRTRLIPFAALNNLTDRRYSSSVVINAAGARYFEPAPGRNFFVGVTLRAAGTQAGP
jgi:iron complex outermembrane receptor protein